MRQLIAGNWKMHGLIEEATAILTPLRRGADGLACDVVVCPPATLIQMASHVLVGSAVQVGAQDCHAHTSGAHTGDVSALMLRDVGASWVIVGHSERRSAHHESDAMARSKIESAMKAGLTPILCVGETEAEREVGQHEPTVGGQLAGSLPDDFRGVVAYEPVWAIGTGRTPSEADIAAMHRFIRGVLTRRFGAAGGKMRILYGGSVKPDNAAALLAVPEVGGALVGGASLKAADFLAIARAAK
jgi:triosephosphate isomerase